MVSEQLAGLLGPFWSRFSAKPQILAAEIIIQAGRLPQYHAARLQLSPGLEPSRRVRIMVVEAIRGS